MQAPNVQSPKDRDICSKLVLLLLRCHWGAGTIMAFFAAVSSALAFFVIGCIPKSEPSLVVAIWFHAASLASSIPFLAVSTSTQLPPLHATYCCPCKCHAYI